MFINVAYAYRTLMELGLARCGADDTGCLVFIIVS